MDHITIVMCNELQIVESDLADLLDLMKRASDIDDKSLWKRMQRHCLDLRSTIEQLKSQ